MKTKEQIIDETVEFYSVDPKGRRAVITVEDGTTRCRNITPDGRCCAVGRLIDVNKIDDGVIKPVASLSETMRVLLDDYQGHPFTFYGDLRSLHDNSMYWNDKGLTDQGRAFVAAMKAEWCSVTEQDRS